jgi:hypothetical protein
VPIITTPTILTIAMMSPVLFFFSGLAGVDTIGVGAAADSAGAIAGSVNIGVGSG